jgi:hypothetical protein
VPSFETRKQAERLGISVPSERKPRRHKKKPAPGDERHTSTNWSPQRPSGHQGPEGLDGQDGSCV